MHYLIALVYLKTVGLSSIDLCAHSICVCCTTLCRGLSTGHLEG